MPPKQHENTLSRRAALQLMYSSEIVDEMPSAIMEDGLCLQDEYVLDAYAQKLLSGVEEHLDEIDNRVIDAAENWSLSRMPIVDRNILRLATYEMLYEPDVPLSVTINEAVEMAKDFGGEDESPKFVNGVLGKIARVISPAEAEALEAEVAEVEAAEAEGAPVVAADDAPAQEAE